MNKVQALHSFWSSFGLKAYDENSVPTGTQFPYLTYETSVSDFNNAVFLTANLWYRSSSWADITAKEAEIANRITRGGCIISYEDGAFWIVKGTPWAQRMGDSSDDMIRRMALNVEIEFLD